MNALMGFVRLSTEITHSCLITANTSALVVSAPFTVREEDKMELHNWMPNLHLGAGIMDFPLDVRLAVPIELREKLSHVTDIQEYRCIRCGETISLPTCPRTSCRHLLSFGCKGKMERIPWKSPMKSRSVEESDINTRDYPAKRKGNLAKKRSK